MKLPVFQMWCAGALCLLALPLGGCNGHRASDPYTPAGETARNPLEAQRLTAEGVNAMQDDPAKAEALFRRALAADLFHGPAHNNLGVLMLSAQPPKLYEAAHEFEWAGKLMPGHPDPQHNLAMTLEAAARYDDALASYRTALETRPGPPPRPPGPDKPPAPHGEGRRQHQGRPEDHRHAGHHPAVAILGGGSAAGEQVRDGWDDAA